MLDCLLLLVPVLLLVVMTPPAFSASCCNRPSAARVCVVCAWRVHAVCLACEVPVVWVRLAGTPFNKIVPKQLLGAATLVAAAVFRCC